MHNCQIHANVYLFTVYLYILNIELGIPYIALREDREVRVSFYSCKSVLSRARNLIWDYDLGPESSVQWSPGWLLILCL